MIESLRTDRITSLSVANAGKKAKLDFHFAMVRQIKNTVSEDIFEHIAAHSIHSLYDLKLSANLCRYDTTHLTKWELQKMTAGVIDLYTNRYKAIARNKTFAVQEKIIVRRYRRDTRSHRKGDVKEYALKMRQTPLSMLLNYCKYIAPGAIDALEIGYRKKKSSGEIEENPGKKALQETLLALREQPDKYERFKRIVALFQGRIAKRLRPIRFSSGSYVKAAVFNKNSKKPTRHSYCYADESNALYRHWYRFKTPKWTIDIPMAHNGAFHAKSYDLDREHYVKWTEKRKLNVGLVFEAAAAFPEIAEGDRVYAAADLNVRDNFAVFFDGKKYRQYDYDDTYVMRFVEELKRIDRLSAEEKKLVANRRRLEKLVRVNQWYFQSLISEILRELKSEGVTDIVLEDLDLSRTSASYVKSEAFQVKYSRLVRLLRLSAVKEWMKRQGENHGIRVHLTNPAYSSQECSKCHVIEKSNRNKERYDCSCGYSGHSDYNAPVNLYNRLHEDVLRQRLHVEDEHGRLLPRKMRHQTVKAILEEYWRENHPSEKEVA